MAATLTATGPTVASAAPAWAFAGRILIYTTTAVQARYVAAVLSEAGVPAGAYCSRGMTAAERKSSLAGWDARKFDVMAATKADMEEWALALTAMLERESVFVQKSRRGGY